MRKGTRWPTAGTPDLVSSWSTLAGIKQLMDWLIDQFVDLLLFDWLVYWLIYMVIKALLIGLLLGLLIERLIDWWNDLIIYYYFIGWLSYNFQTIFSGVLIY